MSRLTDMTDFKIIPQVIEGAEDIVRKAKDEYVCNMLFDLKIDKDVLENQLKEIHRLNDVIREYEELEEQGLLLKLPCKVGTTVYAIATIYECKHDYLDCPMDFPDVYQCERNCKCEYEYKKLVVRPIIFKFEMLKDFNKKVFLTKEEAEQELKRLEGAE